MAPSARIEEVECTDAATVKPNVNTDELNVNLIDLYSVGHTSVLKQWKPEKDEVPFKQLLQLKGPHGEIVHVSALFNGGAMVGAMCTSVFRAIKHRLTGWGPSRKQIRMANGIIVSSEAVWKGVMMLGGTEFEGEFEVFDSKGGWAFLFRKPLMRVARAIHNFETDIVKIRSKSGTITLTNQINGEAAECAIALGVSLTLDAKQWGTLKGGPSGQNPPSRQVFGPQPKVINEQVDKHEHVTEFDPKDDIQPTVTCEEQNQKVDIANSEMGHMESIERNKKEVGGADNTPAKEVPLPPNITESPRQTDTPTAQVNAPSQTDKDKENTDGEETDSTLAKEILIDVVADRLSYEKGDTNLYTSESGNLAHINSVGTEADSIFTQHTNPFKKERVAKILDEMTLGDDLTDEQQEITRSVVKEFADCFALAMSEVNAIPGISHQLKIPEGMTFRTKIGQRSMTPPQRKFLNKKVDEMLAAGIVAPIHPRDVHNIAPMVLVKKVHEGNGVPLDELKHCINDECVSHGMQSAFDMPPRPEP